MLAVLFLVGALGSANATGLPVFVAFRFLGGLAVGGASVVSPLYIAEISPARLRGRLVALNQLNIVAHGAPASEGRPGDIHHLPKAKLSRVKDTGWSCP